MKNLVKFRTQIFFLILSILIQIINNNLYGFKFFLITSKLIPSSLEDSKVNKFFSLLSLSICCLFLFDDLFVLELFELFIFSYFILLVFVGFNILFGSLILLSFEAFTEMISHFCVVIQIALKFPKSFNYIIHWIFIDLKMR